MKNELSDDYDDFFNEIREFFKLNSSLFNKDFLFSPESGFNKDFNKLERKGFKVSYYFEKGMDQPDIKIEGDIDDKTLHEYLKTYKIELGPKFKKIMNSKSVIDSKELLLEPYDQNDTSSVIEPYTEINDFDDFAEIVVEVPGIDLADIIISFNKDGRKLTFSAQNKNRNYLKHIYLSFNSSIDDYILEVNNGLATLKIKKRNY